MHEFATQIAASVFISSQAQIAPSCRIEPGAVICDGVVLETDVLVGPHVVFVKPCGADPAGRAARACVGATIGANATIYPNLTLAAGSVVRPGSVVTRSVPANAIVEGNPASIVGYVGVETGLMHQHFSADGRSVEQTRVSGVTVHHFPVVLDLRGDLTVGEFGSEVPFIPKRYFLVYGTPNRQVRGEHAHKKCQQFLICVQGSCAVVADDGVNRVEISLDASNKGIYLPARTWGIQYKYTADAMLLVFASHTYDPDDYIRDYGEFLSFIKC